MVVPSLGKDLHVAMKSLRGVKHPVILSVSAVVLVALYVLEFTKDQEKALQQEIAQLKKTVDAYSDIRDLRDEERRHFLGSLTTISSTVRVASQVMPQQAKLIESEALEHHLVLCSVIKSVEKIHAEYDAAKRFKEYLSSCKEIAEQITKDSPEEALQEGLASLDDIIDQL